MIMLSWYLESRMVYIVWIIETEWRKTGAVIMIIKAYHPLRRFKSDADSEISFLREVLLFGSLPPPLTTP